VQKAIVAKLDAAFASIEQAIAAAEKNAENAKQLFQSYLSDVFERADEGWVDKHLNDVAVEFGRGKSKHRPRNDPALYGGNYPFLQTGDVRNAGKFVTEYSQTYNENGLKQSKLWPKGTLCITIAANIAEVSILGLDACFPDSIIGLVVDAKQADIEFIYYSLLFAQKILKAKGKGSAQDNINQGTFESMMFKFPDLNTQKIVVENLHAIAVVLEELNTMYSTKNELLTQLKQSLLQQAFNGQLVDA
jgi:type I restriction enzyme S subunit